MLPLEESSSMWYPGRQGRRSSSGYHHASLRQFLLSATSVSYLRVSGLGLPHPKLTATVALFLQLIGAVVITSVQPGDANASSKLTKGKDIAIIGVAVQIICFGLFSVIAIRFNFTSKRFEAEFQDRVGGCTDDKDYAIDGLDRKLKRNWPALLRCVNFASLMILVIGSGNDLPFCC